MAIEWAMRWDAGSVEAILAGGVPVELPAGEDRDPETGEVYVGNELLLWQLRYALAQDLVATLGEQAALEEGAKRARAHIALQRGMDAMSQPKGAHTAGKVA